MSVIRMGDHRSEPNKRADELDAALDTTVDQAGPARDDIEAELAAARSLMAACEVANIPAEPLMALRAALAARRATAATHRRQRLILQRMPYAAAVAAIIAAVVTVTGVVRQQPIVSLNAPTAAAALHALSQGSRQVTQAIQLAQSGSDAHAVETSAVGARNVLARAKQSADALPAASDERSVVLQQVQNDIQVLNSLLSQLNLPPVEPLPPSPPGSPATTAPPTSIAVALPPSTSTTTAKGQAGTQTTTSTTASTPASLGGGPPGPAPTTTTSTTRPTTTTSSSTSSTTSTSTTSTTTSTTTTQQTTPGTLG
jgi:hypothetical protein